MEKVIDQEYTIQQVAEMKNLSAHTLRYYERIGLLEGIQRMDNGHRRYREEDLGWIDFLMLLRQTGMPIEKMQEFMRLAREGDTTIPQRVELLKTHHHELVNHISLLEKHLDHLEYKIGYYSKLLEEMEQDS